MSTTPRFGRRLRQLRAELDLTQEALAERVGCAPQTIRKIEAGERRPSQQMAERLAEVLDIPVAERAAFVKQARTTVALNTESAASAPVVQPRLRPVPRSALPQYATPFIGRANELAQIAQLLSDPACQLITLVGPGGMGKTRLAVEVASRCTHFADGVVFVPLAAVHPPTLVLSAIGDAVGAALAEPDDPAAQLRACLEDKAVLLVLDNLEHVLDGVAELLDLLADAPSVKLLVTSRERLRVQHEWVIELGGLPVAQDDALNDAIALFVERARRVQHGFQLTGAERAAVAEICRLLDGMPLGIELAATWVRLLSCAEIVEQITRSFDFLEASTRDVPDRHQSLRTVFEHSWAMLSAEEQRVLQRLSIFRGGFTRAAAEQVAEASLPLLAALVDKSLVRRTEPDHAPEPARPGTRRYELHELVRQYAAVKLDGDHSDAATTRDRHCRYYSRFLQARETALKSAAAATAVAEVRAELDNVRAALDWAITNLNIEELQRARGAMHWFFENRSRFQEGAALFGRIVQRLQTATGASTQLALGQMLMHHGFFVSRCGQAGTAAALLQQSVALLRVHADQPALSDALLYLGMVGYQMGTYDEARPLLDESLEIAHDLGNQYNIALGLFFVGALAHARGEFEAAAAWFRQDLAVWRAVGYLRGLNLCRSMFSLTLVTLGEHAEAQALLHESLAASADSDDQWGFGTALNHLGLVVQALGDVEEAQYLFRESLALFHEIGNRWDMARTLNHLGAAALAAHDTVAARRHWREALALTAETKAFPDTINALLGLARVLATEEQASAALEICTFILASTASDRSVHRQAASLRDEIITADPALTRAATGAHSQPIELEAFVAKILHSSWLRGTPSANGITLPLI